MRKSSQLAAAEFIQYDHTAAINVTDIALHQKAASSANTLQQINASQGCVLQLETLRNLIRAHLQHILQQMNGQHPDIHHIILNGADIA